MALVNRCTNPRFFNIETQVVQFDGTNQVDIEFSDRHSKVPVVTLIQSTVDPQYNAHVDDTHVQLYVASVTRKGCSILASNTTYTTVHLQIISADFGRPG